LSNPDLLMGGREDVDAARIWPAVKKLLLKACDELTGMRRKEGRNLQRDMTRRIKTATSVVRKVERLSPKNTEEYRRRLESRVRELSGETEIDQRRLAEEVTIYADRSDVTEECIRLKSHLGMFTDALKTTSDVGKRLNFILQEMHREANTLGSKASSGQISELAIQLKEEIEKLREQAQNIE
jgi:uncharacterized protein (TIGR00255 family)